MLDFKCCAVLESKPVALPCEGKQVGPTEGRPGAFLAQRRSSCGRLTALTILSPISADLHGECTELSCPVQEPL